MKDQTRSAQLNEICVPGSDSPLRQCQSVWTILFWLLSIYHLHASSFSLKVDIKKEVKEATHMGMETSPIRVVLWRARILTGCYQVNGQALATCILIKEAHFFRV
jgi:hypothetical protein